MHGGASAPPLGWEREKIKIWIPVAAIVVVLALTFCGLFFLTDLFKSGDDGPTAGGIITTSPGTSASTSANEASSTSQRPVDPPDPVDATMPGVDGRLDVTGETNFEVVPNNMQMQDSGGSLRIINESEVEFTPDRSGSWGIWTSDNGTDDPLLILFDESGNILEENDDYGNSRNSYISYDLEAGTAYTVSAGFYIGTTGEYTLTIDYRTGPGRDNINVDHTLMLEAGSHQVNDETVFLFTAPDTGIYVFKTSDSGAYDPYLTIYDYYGDYFAHDDDKYDGINAWLPVWLHEGYSYFLVAGFYMSNQGNYVLNVISPEVIPGDGGTLRIDGETTVTFIPDQSGDWEFRMSDSSRSEPRIRLFDAWGNEKDYNSNPDIEIGKLIDYDLRAGETYTIHCGFSGYDRAYSYTLTIRRA